MFTAFAIALGDIHNTHKTMRRAAIQWSRANKEILLPFLPDNYNGDINWYLRDMAKPKEYGDNLMLEALCRAHNVLVAVLNRDPQTGEMEWSLVGDSTGEETERLGLYLSGEHYENLVTVGDVYGN